jgi:hypothetical protein
MLEHLPECSGPFGHAGSNKSFKLFFRRPATSPGASLGSKGARVFRNEISATRSAF